MSGKKPLTIGVLASGRGSNFQSILEAISAEKVKARIAVLITDNPEAGAIQRAQKHDIDYLVIEPGNFDLRREFYHEICRRLEERQVDLVVLAGFMRIVGPELIRAFPNRIMNIHPALLPAFPGLHGQKQAVQYGVKIAGCTVHFVDEGMDTGPIIMQAAVPVYDWDGEESLSERILVLEHKIYPEAIRLFQEGRLRVEGRIVKIDASPHASQESLISACTGN